MSRIIRTRRAADRAPRPATSEIPSLPEAGHLADVLSHRLRGLVSGILGYTDLLLEQLSRRGQRELAMRILESAQRIEHVLADLKHYTRPVAPHAEEVPVGEIVADVIRRLPDDVAERIRLELGTLAEVAVRADRYLARDILLLLLQNAAEAVRPPGPLELSAARDGAGIWFDVANEGTLDEETVAHLFEPFFTTKARNLGVGLPLARRLARMQHGDVVRLSPAPPGSVVFRFLLPAAGG